MLATAKVLNLRLNGNSAVYDWNKLHYLSCATPFIGETVQQYGESRVKTEFLDLWLQKKVSYSGLGFDDSDVSVTDAELAKLPLGESFKNVDATKFEVLIRNGGKLEVHPDDIKFWLAQDSNFANPFSA